MKMTIYDQMTAVLTVSLISLMFVLSVYIWPSHRFRDHPETIKRRFVSVISVTTCSLMYLSYVYDQWLWSQLVFYEISFHNTYKTILRPLWITICFFAGHLLSIAIYRRAECKERFETASDRLLIIIRNYFIAPASEEITYRLVMNRILFLSQFGPVASSLISSALFSVAHSHHYLLRNYTGHHTNLTIAFCQLFYTFLFALYASTIYWQSASVWGCIVLHSFCNLLEFPDFQLLSTDRRLFYTTIVGLIAGFVHLTLV